MLATSPSGVTGRQRRPACHAGHLLSSEATRPLGPPQEVAHGLAQADRVLMVPSTNTTSEADFQLAVPRGITVHGQRLWLTNEGTGDEVYDRMNAEIEAGARYLATAKVDVIVYGCTTGSFFKGPGWDREMCGIIQHASGVPAVATSPSVVEALRALGARQVWVATPYPDWNNEKLRAYLEAHGFQVLNAEGEPRAAASGNQGINDQDPESVVEFASRVCRPEADALLCSCTAWNPSRPWPRSRHGSASQWSPRTRRRSGHRCACSASASRSPALAACWKTSRLRPPRPESLLPDLVQRQPEDRARDRCQLLIAAGVRGARPTLPTSPLRNRARPLGRLPPGASRCDSWLPGRQMRSQQGERRRPRPAHPRTPREAPGTTPSRAAAVRYTSGSGLPRWTSCPVTRTGNSSTKRSASSTGPTRVGSEDVARAQRTPSTASVRTNVITPGTSRTVPPDASS